MKANNYDIKHYPSSSVLLKRETTTTGINVSGYSPYYYGSSLTEVMTRNLAMTLPVVNRCANLIADSIAKIPIKYQRLMGDGTYVDMPEGNDLHYILSVAPNDRMTANTFWRTIVLQCAVGEGNAYVVPVMQDNGRYAEWVLCSPGACYYDENLNIYRINDVYNPQINGTYFPRQILHFFFRTITGRKGVSCIEFARSTMDIAATGNSETLDRFASSGLGRGIVGGNNSQSDIYGEHDYDELEQVAVDVEKQWRNGRRIASIPEEVHYEGVNMTSADLEFLATRKFENKQICLFFGLDGSYSGEADANNYKSAEIAEQNLREFTLEPWIKAFENEMQRKIVPSNLCHRYRIVFDRDMLYAASPTAKADYYSKMLQGVMTVNEVRAKEGLTPVENGDKILVSANLKTIEGLMSEATTQTDSIDNNENIEDGQA